MLAGLLSGGPIAGQSVPEIKAISLQRTACFGQCPIYTVTLVRVGPSLFDGQRWSPRVGQFEGTIDSSAFASLAHFIVAEGFLTFDSAYAEGVTDHSTTITCLQSARASRCISHYGASGPAQLNGIEHAIDSVSETLHWAAKKGGT